MFSAKIKRLFKLTSPVIALAILALGSLMPTGVAHASWGVNNQHQMIPLYIYPDWWNTNNAWSFVCSNSNASNIGSTIIANGINAPTPTRNTDYAQVIEMCHDDGHNVIGYVDTSYGAVPLATVKANVDKWFDQYNGDNTGVYDLGDTGSDTQIDGIFLDQVSNFPGDTVTGGDNISVGAYYREIFEYIKDVAPEDYNDVVGNPGATAPTDWQLDDIGQNPTQIADELMIFEGTAETLANYTQPEWVEDYPASDISMLVYDVQYNDIASVCTALKGLHAGLVDVTNETIHTNPDATPWNFVQDSTYWSSFRSSCG